MRVIGYLRVSSRDQDYGIEVQRETTASEAGRRGWDVVWIIDEGETGKNSNRLGLTEALAILDRGDADALVVSKLDRLSRSGVDSDRDAVQPNSACFGTAPVISRNVPPGSD